MTAKRAISLALCLSISGALWVIRTAKPAPAPDSQCALDVSEADEAGARYSQFAALPSCPSIAFAGGFAPAVAAVLAGRLAAPLHLLNHCRAPPIPASV